MLRVRGWRVWISIMLLVSPSRPWSSIQLHFQPRFSSPLHCVNQIRNISLSRKKHIYYCPFLDFYFPLIWRKSKVDECSKLPDCWSRCGLRSYIMSGKVWTSKWYYWYSDTVSKWINTTLQQAIQHHVYKSMDFKVPLISIELKPVCDSHPLVHSQSHYHKCYFW